MESFRTSTAAMRESGQFGEAGMTDDMREKLQDSFRDYEVLLTLSRKSMRKGGIPGCFV